MIRTPIVNGQFYPNKTDQLEKTIKGYRPSGESKIDAKGIILPHAGYLYSGRVAVTTVSKVLAKKRLIILGPNHSGLGVNFAIWPKGKWNTPLGDVAVDEELAALILSKSDIIEENYASHRNEHSIEVELPILQYFFGEFSFVPIACMQADSRLYQKVAAEIAEAIKAIKNDILLIASTDLTHYEPDPAARRKDSLAIEAIINLDEDGLVQTVSKNEISMCGLAPVAIFISCLRKLGAKKAQVALYQTSADFSGDSSSVVGYAGIIIK